MTRMFFHLFFILICLLVSSCSLLDTEETVSPSEIEGEIDNIEVEAAEGIEESEDFEDLDIETADAEAPKSEKNESVAATDSFDDIENFNEGMIENELSEDNSNASDVSAVPPANSAEESATEPIDDLDLEVATIETNPKVTSDSVVLEETPALSNTAQNTITNLEYKSEKSGGSVVITASTSFQYQVRDEKEFNQTIIEIADVKLPDRFKLPYIAKDFEQPVATVNAYQEPGSSTARFVIQYKNRLKPAIQQIGNNLIVMNSGVSSSITTTVAGNETADKEDLEAVNTKTSSKKLTIEMQDVSIKDLISYIADEVGVNVIIDNDVNGTTSVKLKDIPWEEALAIILKTNGLAYERRGDVLRVAQLTAITKEYDQESSRLEAQSKAENASQSKTVKVIPVNYANLEDLVAQVKPFMSQTANVIVDKRSSSIILNDYADPLKRAEKLIQSLDVQPVQVLIEGKIVEASETFSREVGIQWSQNGGSLGVGTQDLTFNQSIRGGSNPSSVSGGYLTNLTLGTFDNIGDITASLAIFEREEKIKILSSPKIVTLNKERATIESTQAVASFQSIVVPNVGTQNNVVFVDAKLSLAVTPQVSFNSDMILDLEVSRDIPGPPVGDLQNRGVNKRSAKSKVIIKDGQSLVIGGIFGQNENLVEAGVPLLKDIPILGYLFKSKRKELDKTELLIFLTPKILNPENMLRTTQISSSGEIVKSPSETSDQKSDLPNDNNSSAPSDELKNEVDSL